ncbi:vps8 subunit of corvet complex [Anaeramoeba flamelloides]|uniref:Vps8 subunit of corvet complex n=1 Tax=Anaeramoeba flamelloides TaxID=1746091 RepID=A0AAV7YZE5_9EUKA|nr:vps8 subunit of corvet complex [Anaeramoeba flamelloides]
MMYDEYTLEDLLGENSDTEPPRLSPNILSYYENNLTVDDLLVEEEIIPEKTESDIEREEILQKEEEEKKKRLQEDFVDETLLGSDEKKIEDNIISVTKITFQKPFIVASCETFVGISKNEKQIIIYDSNFNPHSELSLKKDSLITCMSFYRSKKITYLAVGQENGTLTLINLANKSQKVVKQFDQLKLTGVHMYDTQHFLLTTWSGQVFKFNNVGFFNKPLFLNKQLKLPNNFNIYQIYPFNFSNLQIIAICSNIGIFIVDLKHEQLIQKIEYLKPNDPNVVPSLCWTKLQNNYYLLLSQDKNLQIWKISIDHRKETISLKFVVDHIDSQIITSILTFGNSVIGILSKNNQQLKIIMFNQKKNTFKTINTYVLNDIQKEKKIKKNKKKDMDLQNSLIFQSCHCISSINESSWVLINNNEIIQINLKIFKQRIDYYIQKKLYLQGLLLAIKFFKNKTIINYGLTDDLAKNQAIIVDQILKLISLLLKSSIKANLNYKKKIMNLIKFITLLCLELEQYTFLFNQVINIYKTTNTLELFLNDFKKFFSRKEITIKNSKIATNGIIGRSSSNKSISQSIDNNFGFGTNEKKISLTKNLIELFLNFLNRKEIMVFEEYLLLTNISHLSIDSMRELSLKYSLFKLYTRILNVGYKNKYDPILKILNYLQTISQEILEKKESKEKYKVELNYISNFFYTNLKKEFKNKNFEIISIIKIVLFSGKKITTNDQKIPLDFPNLILLLNLNFKKTLKLIKNIISMQPSQQLEIKGEGGGEIVKEKKIDIEINGGNKEKNDMDQLNNSLKPIKLDHQKIYNILYYLILETNSINYKENNYNDLESFYEIVILLLVTGKVKVQKTVFEKILNYLFLKTKSKSNNTIEENENYRLNKKRKLIMIKKLKKKEELSILFLKSINNTKELNNYIRLIEHVKYKSVLTHLYQKTQNYRRLIELIINDATERDQIFTKIEELSNFQNIKQNEKLLDSIIIKFGDLLLIDKSKATTLILDSCPHELKRLLHSLKEESKIIFIEALLEYFSIDSYKLEDLSLDINDLKIKHLQLIGKLKPDQLLYYFKIYNNDQLSLDVQKKIATTNKIMDAEAFITERSGDLDGAKKLMKIKFSQVIDSILLLIKRISPNEIISESRITEIIKFRKTYENIKAMYHRIFPKDIENHTEREDFWKYYLLVFIEKSNEIKKEKELQKKKKLKTKKPKLQIQKEDENDDEVSDDSEDDDIYRRNKKIYNMKYSLLFNLMNFFLDDILNEITITSLISTLLDNFENEKFSKFQKLLKNLFATYQYEIKLLGSLNNFIDQDVIKSTEQFRAKREQPFKRNNDVCLACETKLRNHNQRLITIFNCGHSFHQDCIKNSKKCFICHLQKKNAKLNNSKTKNELIQDNVDENENDIDIDIDNYSGASTRTRAREIPNTIDLELLSGLKKKQTLKSHLSKIQLPLSIYSSDSQIEQINASNSIPQANLSKVFDLDY